MGVGREKDNTGGEGLKGAGKPVGSKSRRLHGFWGIPEEKRTYGGGVKEWWAEKQKEKKKQGQGT